MNCNTKICPHCKTDFSREEDGEEHHGIIRWEDGGDEWNVCPVCNSKWKSNKKYDEEKQCHVEVEPGEYFVLHSSPDGVVRWLKIKL